MLRISKRALEERFVERAKELAATGDYASVRDIEQKLWSEGCANASSLLDAGWIRDDLMSLISAAPRKLDEIG